MKTSLFNLSFFSLFLLTIGCTKPDLTMENLGLSLQGTLTYDKSGSSQSGGENPHVISGSCPISVTNLEICIDCASGKSNWVSIDDSFKNSDGVETVTPAAPSGWDLDCSDGTYKFWIFNSKIVALGITSTPQSALLRGKSGIAYTQQIELVDSGSNLAGPPVKFEVVKLGQPINAVGQNSCMGIELSLLDANGARTSSSSTINLLLKANKSGATTTANYNYWTSYEACSSYSTPQDASTGLSIPAQQQSVVIYYRPNNSNFAGSGNDNVGDILSFTTYYSGTQPSLVNATTNSITVKDQYAKPYLSFQLPQGLVKGLCYPASIQNMSFNGYAYTSGSQINLSFVGLPTGVGFYTDATCSTTTLTSVINSGSYSSAALYFKADSGLSLNRVTLSVSGSTGDPNIDPEPGSYEVYLDSASNNLGKLLNLSGPNSLYSGSCQPYEVNLLNSHRAAVIANTGFSFNLNSSASGKGKFYTDFSCTNQISGSMNFPANQYSMKVYYRGDFGGMVSLSTSSTSYTSDPLSLSISGPQKIYISTSAPSVVNHYECHPITLQVQNSDLSFAINLPSSVTVNVSGVTNGALYSDQSCQTTLSGQLPTSVPSGFISKTLYWRPYNIGVSSVNLTGLTFSSSAGELDSVTHGTVAINPAASIALNNDILSNGNLIVMGTDEFLIPSAIGTGAAPFSFLQNSGSGNLQSVAAIYNLNVYKSASSPGTLAASLTLKDSHDSGMNNSSVISLNTLTPHLSFNFVDATSLATSRVSTYSNVTPSHGRSTSASYYNSSGLLTLASANMARLDYDPSSCAGGGTCLQQGLLIESTKDNLVSFSEDFANATNWPEYNNSYFNLTRTSGAVDPKGSALAVTLGYTGGGSMYSGSTFIGRSLTSLLAAGSKYTISIYVKKVSGPTSMSSALQLDDGTGNYSPLVWEYTGAGLKVQQSPPYSSFSPEKVGYQALPNGWFRVWGTFTLPGNWVSGSSTAKLIVYPVYNGTGYSGYPDNSTTGSASFFGAQVESGDMSSYFPCLSTHSASCIRGGDLLSVPATDGTTAWYSSTAGTFKMEWQEYGQSIGGAFMRDLFTVNGTYANTVHPYINAYGSVITGINHSGGNTLTGYSLSPLLRQGINSYALSYNFVTAGSAYMVMNGNIQQVSLSSNNTGTWSTVYIGSGSSSGQINGHIRSFKYWKDPLSPAAIRSMGYPVAP